MKIKFSFTEFVLGALVVGAIAYTTNRGSEAMMRLRALFPRSVLNVEAQKAAAVPPAAPLERQIPLCRSHGPGFQACMFAAGYAVNSAWTSAHDASRPGPGGMADPARVNDFVDDQYRAGPSPAYGVPYWIPRTK